MRMLLGYFYEADTYIWLVCGLVQVKEQTPQKHMSKREWTMSSKFINYSTPNNEQNWENPCTQLRNQQRCTSDNHD